MARKSTRQKSNAARPRSRGSSELSNIRALKREFDRVHKLGMVALRAGDYRTVGRAIKREATLIAKQTAMIDGAGKPPADTGKEWRELTREHQALTQQQKKLEARPGDIAAHEEHRRKLHDHVARLHAHTQRLHAERLRRSR